ncbi:phosphatase PAP2 family protein [Leucobacter allii]|uniref:phosphatase PAP2 family protein n=1 Tax=Leucobacter allii TaxID=2932247 RepID=UPI001FD3FAAC|nr:phosphatase PAP2 family protein [Leucobacter allii]UOR03057.1 phosphatase PAP2 family protein [Leucobacter allii]
MSGVRAGSAPRLRALWIALFWIAVGVASYILGVRSALGQQAEASVLDAAEFTTDPPAPLNLVSIPTIAIALAAIGVIAALAHGFARAARVVLVAGAAIATSQLLKGLVLSRPTLFELDDVNTFPSGHMTVFTALVAALALAVPDRLRAIVALAGTALLSVVGWQLLAYGWHRPSDVFGALALGVALFAAVSALWPLRGSGRPALGGGIGIGLALCGWIVVAAATALAANAGITANADLMLSAGEFGAVGASALTARSVLRLGSVRN